MIWIREGSWVLGTLGVLGFGSWIGLLVYYSTKFLGTDYLPIKAMFLTMTLESLLFSIFGVLGKNAKLVQNVSGNFVHASAAAIGGLCVGLLMKKYILAKK